MLILLVPILLMMARMMTAVFIVVKTIVMILGNADGDDDHPVDGSIACSAGLLHDVMSRPTPIMPLLMVPCCSALSPSAAAASKGPGVRAVPSFYSVDALHDLFDRSRRLSWSHLRSSLSSSL
jgi:hypothetical protein